jgi:hypothetical protein
MGIVRQEIVHVEMFSYLIIALSGDTRIMLPLTGL